MRPGRGRFRVSVLGARALAALASGLAVTAVALPLVGGHDYLPRLLSTPEVAVALSFSITGALLVGNANARRMGWLLLLVGAVAGLFTASVSWTAYVLEGDSAAALPAGSGLALLTAWITTWAWYPPYVLVLTLLPQVVPHGRPLPGPWRLLHAATWALLLLGVATFALTPGELGIFTGVTNPLGAPDIAAWLERLEPVVLAGVPVLGLAAIGSLMVRLRRADGVERRQVGWVGYAAALAAVVVLVAGDELSSLAVLLIPAGIAVAALRYRLYDLDLVVNRTVVAVLLLGSAAVAYVALVAWVGSLVGSSTGAAPFVAVFAVALAFHPARIWLQRRIDRLFFGRRGDPYSLLRDLDRALRDAASPREALAAAAELLRSGLRLSGVAVVVPLRSGTTVVEQVGQVGAAGTTVPLVLHDESVGELRAGGRGGGAPDATDVRVLQSMAGPLASAAYALRLSGDLEESRRHILETREDERRRVRRDLHDGLGPQLAGVVMGLDVIRSTLSRGDVERAAALATTVGDQTRTAVEDVRRLVAGLRPPVLDDLGLVGALRAITPATDGGPHVQLTAWGELAVLPAAVEVAAYRIASEAVTNALRHSGGSRIEVRLCVDTGVMRVQVEDDGWGLPADVRSGVGLVSMRERAAELGGRCIVESSSRGTTVVAELPLGPA